MTQFFGDVLMNIPPIEEYALLYILENELRKLIENELPKVSSKWWKERIPEDVRRNAEKRIEKKKQLWPWHPAKSKNILHFLDFTDYMKIIVRKGNWRDVFQRIFNDKDLLLGKLKELKPIRDSIAHSRFLTQNERDILRINAKSILVSIWNYRINSIYVEPALELLDKGDLEKAKKLLKNGFDETKDGWVAFNLGKIYERIGELSEAMWLYEFSHRTMPLPEYRKMAEEAILRIQRKMKKIVETKKCPRCGEELPAKYVYCGMCGYKIS